MNHFREGERAPKRDREHAPAGGNPADEIAKVKVIADPDAPPPLLDAGMVTEKYRHPISYCRRAIGMALLREQIIGPERFGGYLAAAALKGLQAAQSVRLFPLHRKPRGRVPVPALAGLVSAQLAAESRVTNPSYSCGNFYKGRDGTVADLRPTLLPATSMVTCGDRTRQEVRMPPDTWQQHRSSVVQPDRTQRVKTVTSDPCDARPDVARDNSTVVVLSSWPANRTTRKPAAKLPCKMEGKRRSMYPLKRNLVIGEAIVR